MRFGLGTMCNTPINAIDFLFLPVFQLHRTLKLTSLQRISCTVPSRLINHPCCGRHSVLIYSKTFKLTGIPEGSNREPMPSLRKRCAKSRLNMATWVGPHTDLPTTSHTLPRGRRRRRRMWRRRTQTRYHNKLHPLTCTAMEEDDPVVQEVNVYLSQALSEALYLLQVRVNVALLKSLLPNCMYICVAVPTSSWAISDRAWQRSRYEDQTWTGEAAN